MTINIIEIILFGVSVCTDCFAVSLCSSINMKDKSAWNSIKIALCFAFIQAGLLLIGWKLGYELAHFTQKITSWIGLLLLLYVGIEMLREAFDKGQSKVTNLNSFKNIILAAVATSIDALALGGSLSLVGQDWHQSAWKAVSVFICTALSVVVGIIGSRFIAQVAGKWAEGIGGVVLILIGISIVL